MDINMLAALGVAEGGMPRVVPAVLGSGGGAGRAGSPVVGCAA